MYSYGVRRSPGIWCRRRFPLAFDRSEGGARPDSVETLTLRDRKPSDPREMLPERRPAGDRVASGTSRLPRISSTCSVSMDLSGPEWDCQLRL
ncbi:hypothetical protein MKX07_002873 [Trichoderma sp. CBMAI-0711]|nr:hypothetical protein MKX07_002873 [Trichoderma sp. CBMAI-0711]